MITAMKLLNWLSSLPGEMEEADVGAALGGYPSSAKRIIAFRFKGEPKTYVAVNQMGTHFSDGFYDKIEIISILDSRGIHPQPDEEPSAESLAETPSDEDEGDWNNDSWQGVISDGVA